MNFDDTNNDYSDAVDASTDARICPYCDERPLSPRKNAKTCAHVDCQTERARSYDRVRRPPITNRHEDRPCPYCNTRQLSFRPDAVTCGHDDCRTLHQNQYNHRADVKETRIKYFQSEIGRTKEKIRQEKRKSDPAYIAAQRVRQHRNSEKKKVLRSMEVRYCRDCYAIIHESVDVGNHTKKSCSDCQHLRKKEHCREHNRRRARAKKAAQPAPRCADCNVLLPTESDSRLQRCQPCKTIRMREQNRLNVFDSRKAKRETREFVTCALPECTNQFQSKYDGPENRYCSYECRYIDKKRNNAARQYEERNAMRVSCIHRDGLSIIPSGIRIDPQYLADLSDLELDHIVPSALLTDLGFPKKIIATKNRNIDNFHLMIGRRNRSRGKQRLRDFVQAKTKYPELVDVAITREKRAVAYLLSVCPEKMLGLKEYYPDIIG